MSARAQGLNWQPIQATYFPNKTPNACRKRHERLMDRRNSDDWDVIKLENMAKEYMGMRREIWSQLGAKTGEKWNVVEAKVSLNTSPAFQKAHLTDSNSACNRASKTSNPPRVPAPAVSALKAPAARAPAPAARCSPCNTMATIHTVRTATPTVPMTVVLGSMS
jgi:hypothetical protein